MVTGSIPGLSTSKKRFSSRAYERTCGMVRGKTRGTHSISNLLFSLFKIGPLPATQNSGGGGGDMGGAAAGRGGRKYGGTWTQKKEEEKSLLLPHVKVSQGFTRRAQEA